MNTISEPVEFTSTPGGTVALGIRRLSRLFGSLILLMVLAALAAWISGRLVPSLLALSVVALIGLTWRMSNDLRPRKLSLEPGRLVIETPRQLIEVPIEGATIRPLSESEIAHLEGLASAGGVVAGSGGFDSRHLGEFDLYASNLSHALFIQGLEARMVVTPDEPVGFTETFERMAASPLLQSSAHE
jgi:hypothetical protein